MTATLDGPAPENGTTVTLTTGGTATLDTDYTLASTAITIAEGETAGTAVISIIDDTELEAEEPSCSTPRASTRRSLRRL